MKKLLTLTIMLIGFTANARQNAVFSIEDPKMDNYLLTRKLPVLTVQVNDIPKDSTKVVPIKYTVVQLGVGFQSTRYAETGTNGIAKIVLDQNFPYQQIWLSIGEYFYAGVYVNSNLTVTLDLSKFNNERKFFLVDGVSYTGEDGELNLVMNKHVMYKKAEREKLNSRLVDLAVFRKNLSKETFTISVDSVRRELDRLDREFLSNYPAYQWAVRGETLSDYYAWMAYSYSFDSMPAQLFEQLRHHKPYFTSNDVAQFYRNLSTYVRTFGQKRGLSPLARGIALSDSLFNKEKSDLVKMAFLESEKDVYSQSYSQIISSLSARWGKNLAENELKKAQANQKRIDALYTNAEKLEKAFIGKALLKLPFGAELYSLNTVDNIDNLLLSLRSKFPGKALILDFWATWCGPCLEDLPKSKALHKANQDLPIEYIYLCTSSGSSLETWKKRVGELEVPGTHIFVEDKVVAQFKNLLGANGGYPAYVVIDAAGKVHPKIITRMGMLNRESLNKVAGL